MAGLSSIIPDMSSADVFDLSRRRRLHLKPGRERAIRNRHPWIFEGAIRREDGDPDAAIADVIAPDGTVVASGFYSSASQIRLRALAFGEAFELEWLRQRIVRSVEARRDIAGNETTAVRLVNSEGDGLSGLVVDRYGDVLVVEISSAGLEAVADLVAEELVRAVDDAPIARVIFNNNLPVRKIEGLTLTPRTIEIAPGAADEVVVLENGLRFAVTPGKGQKTGFFLDQRDNRLLVRELARGRSVLNLFGYTGGFGVNAAAGGADRVEEVDISAPAIEVAKRNHDLNGTGCPVSYVVADAFDHVRACRDSGSRFDLVIVDPPAFAKSKKDIERAARGYKDIIMNGLRLVGPGGSLMAFSCSGHISADLFQKIVFGASADAERDAQIIHWFNQSADHPVLLSFPEGHYLKGLVCRVV